MSCLNNQRMKNLDYVRVLAKTLANVNQQNVDILKLERSGIGEVYDYVLSENNDKKPFETVAYVRDDHGQGVLSDNEDERIQPIVVEQTKKSKRKSFIQPVDGDSGNVLPEDRPS